MTATKQLMRCSFCGQSQHEVAKLIAGPSVYICDGCVGLCNDILDDDASRSKVGTLPREASDVPTEELRARLANAAAITADVDQRLQQAVDVLRSRGQTWTQIGEALGVSRQAAWERFASED